MKRALVTGAAGFIGCHVVRQLLEENVEVRALLRPGERRDNLEGLDIEIQEGDILDRAAVEAAVEGVDTVFHLAGIYAIWMTDWSRMYEVNIQGSRNVAWSALRHRVDRVVHTSSIAAIGVAPGRQPSREDTPFNQYTLGHHYVLSKHLAQQEALGFAENGLDVVVVNPAFPFGPRDIGPTPTGKIIVDILSGVNRFYFTGGINVVDVNDVARGHVLAAKKGRRGELYILGNRNMEMRDFSELVCRVAGINASRLIRLPVPAVKGFASAFTWWSNHVSKSPPISTPTEVAYAAQHLYYDNAKARDELGLQLTDIEDTLRSSIAWFREHGYVK